jgi:protein SCO1/2
MKMTSFRSWSHLCLPALLLLAGCRATPPPASAPEQTSHAFAARGVIEQIAPDHHQVTIHHETIPGYMMEMTMDFPVNDTAELDGLTPGDKITFTLHVSQDRDWVSDLHRIGHADAASTNAMSMSMPMDNGAPQLKPGDPMPDGELIAEDGRHIHLSDFRGKVVALTFFFTRCPLPNYCPLMNSNFAKARSQLLADAKAPANWELLSISFDADFDTPEVLHSYAEFYRQHNPDRWLFAAGSARASAWPDDHAAGLEHLAQRAHRGHRSARAPLLPVQRQPLDARAIGGCDRGRCSGVRRKVRR